MDLTIGLGHGLTIAAVLVSGGVTLGTLRTLAAQFRDHETRDRVDFQRGHDERATIRKEISEVCADVARLEGKK